MPKSPETDKPTTDAGRDDTVTPGGRGWLPSWLRALLFGLAYAGLLALSSSPINLWWVGFITPLPLVWLAVRPGMSPARAGFWAAIGSVPWWAYSHSWAASVSTAGVVPLVIYLSLWTMLFVWIAGFTAKRWPTLTVLTIPLVWVGLEYLRGSVVFNGYAWFLAAHPMIDSPGSGLARPASYGGTYLVSWLVLLGVCGGAGLRVGKGDSLNRRIATASLAVWVLWLALGLTLWRTSSIRSDLSLRVAVAQSNVPQSNKLGWTFTQRYLDWLDMRALTIEAADTEPDLIVWPETMFPGLTLDDASRGAEEQAELVWRIDQNADPRLNGLGEYIGATTIANELLAMQRALETPMLVGATGFEGLEVVERPDGGLGYDWATQYNSVFLIHNGRLADSRYDKIRLMAFGEVMPYIHAWPWLQQKLLDIGAEGMSFTLTPGTRRTVFEIPITDRPEDARVVTPICFESTMPSLCRSLVFRGGNRRAGLMVNPSNDGWFGSSVPMREHYLRAARWRCVELATPMVRACNTGISAAIDTRGRILADSWTTPEGGRALASGVLVANVPLGRGVTIYGRLGDLFAGGCAVLTLIIVGGGVIGRMKNKRSAEAVEPKPTPRADP